MTAPDELERAVERITRYANYIPTDPFNAKDLRLLLSERGELLATVERMRGGLKKITTNYGPRHLAHQIARAALTTGEANHKDKP